MKYLLIVLIFILTVPIAEADTLTLQQCLKAARELSGLSKFDADYAEMERLKQSVLNSYQLPEISLQGVYSYQSDVVSFPEGPFFTGPDVPNGQGRVWLDIQQPIYLAGKPEIRNSLESISIQLERMQWEKEMLNLDKQVSELFFAISLSRKREELQREVLEDTRRKREQVVSWVHGGLKSALDLHRFDALILQQETTLQETLSRKQSLEKLLSDLIGFELEGVSLKVPSLEFPVTEGDWQTISIKEWRLRREQLEWNERSLQSNRKPFVAAFMQAGFGQPNPFNFFETDLSGYYIIGIKAGWQLVDWGRAQKERDIITLKMKQWDDRSNKLIADLDTQFQQLAITYNQHETMLQLHMKQLENQLEIVRLSQLQYEEGIISSAQYLEELDKREQYQIQCEIDKTLYQKTIWEAHLLLENF